jgi:DNA (cytosine-5)-methyltransferase 1
MEQQTIFDILYPKFKIDKPIRLIELFSGYGSQALALKYLGIKFEHWKICEWAVKSIQAYKDIHFTDVDIELNQDRTKEQMVDFLYQKGISADYNKPMTKEQISRLSMDQLKTVIKNIAITHNLVNIQQVKGKDLEIKDTQAFTYLLTYSFPCQDLSLAGSKKGMSDTSTRSGMLWEVERILQECKELGNLPQVLLMENVPQVHGEGAKEDFNKWQLRLEELGYKNYWQDLIATDYGIPQTRNRCFMVSILGDYNYTFPKPIPLKLRLKDMLEDQVDKKYYLSEKMIQGMINTKFHQYQLENRLQDLESSIDTLTTSTGERAPHVIKDIPKIPIKNATNKGYLEAELGDGIDISSRMEYHRGTVQKGKSQTITTMGGGRCRSGS